MTVDWTISVGAILVAVVNLIGLGATGIAVYWKTREWIMQLHTDNKLELAAIKTHIVGLETMVKPMWERFTGRRDP